ncbi:hypothetical protein RLOatenuis_6970 [Rickettsiales bacterium]|nr:hypothetical protein RLOatenuis_6970 [Rickettsiales bacterium]
MPEKLNFGPSAADLRRSELKRHLDEHNTLLQEAQERGLFTEPRPLREEIHEFLEGHFETLMGAFAHGQNVSRTGLALEETRGYIHARAALLPNRQVNAAAHKAGFAALARLRVLYNDIMHKYHFEEYDQAALDHLVRDTRNRTTDIMHGWLDQYQNYPLERLKSGEVFVGNNEFDSPLNSLIMVLDNMSVQEVRALLDYGDRNVAKALFGGLVAHIATNQNLHSKVTEKLPKQYQGMRKRVARKILNILPLDYSQGIVKNSFDELCSNPQKETDSKYFYIADILNNESETTEELAANRIGLEKALGLEDQNGKIFIERPSNPRDPKECDDRIVTLLEIIYKQPDRLSSENVRELLTARNGETFKKALTIVSSGTHSGLLSTYNISANQDEEKFESFLNHLKAAAAAAYDSTEWQPVLLEALNKVDLQDSMHNAQLETLRSEISGQISNAQLLLTKENLIQVLAQANGADQIRKLVKCMTEEEAGGRRQQFIADYPAFKSELEYPIMDNLKLLQDTLASGLEEAGFPSAHSSEQIRNKAIMQTLSMLIRTYSAIDDELEQQNFSESLMQIHKQAVEEMQDQVKYYRPLLTKDLAYRYKFISDEIPNLADDALWRLLQQCTAESRKPTNPADITNWNQNVKETADAFPELLRNGSLAGAHNTHKIGQAKNVERILLDVKRALSNPNYTQEQKNNLETRVISVHSAAKELARLNDRHEGMSIISQAIERYFPSTLALQSQIMTTRSAERKDAAKKIPAEQVTAPVKVDPQKDPKGVKSVNPVATKTTPAPSTQKKPDPQAKPKETEVKEKVVTATTATKQTKPATTATTAVEEKQPWYKRYQSTLGYSALFVLAVITTPLLCTFVAPLAAGAAFWAVAIIGGVLGLVGLGGAIYSGYQTWQEDKAQEASQALKKAPEAPAIEAKKDATQSPGTDVSNTSSAAPIAPQTQTVAVGA